MNQESWDVLNTITKKELHELTNHDKAFIRARRAYLTREQKDKFSSILKDKSVSKTPATYVAVPAKDGRISYKELQIKAKSLGLPYRNIPRETIERSIEAVEGPVSALHPQ